MSSKINLRKLLLMVTMLFPITTIIERYLGFLNKSLLVVSLFLLFVITLQNGKVKRKSFIFACFSILTYCISLFISPMAAIKINPNMAVYYIFLILYYLFFIDQKQKIEKDLLDLRNYIFIIVVSYTVFLTLTIFLPGSHIAISAGGWGDDRYFASFSNSPNRVGPACLFIMVLLIYLLRFGKKREWLFILMLPQIYAGLAGGSRTYFALILTAALIYIYYWLHPKKIFWLTIIPITLIVFYFVGRSSMMTKIEISLSYLGTGNTYEFWRRLTNSRSVLWPERINAYKGFTTFHKLFGAGVNYTSYTFGLWSHDDFIEILCSYGIIGLANYCFIMFKLYKTFVNKNAPLFMKLLVVFIWLFNATFNFFYCYFNAVLCYPILLITLHEGDWEGLKLRDKERVDKTEHIIEAAKRVSENE